MASRWALHRYHRGIGAGLQWPARSGISSRRRTAARHALRGQLDNTRQLDGIHWRHVKFIEQFSPDRSQDDADDERRLQACSGPAASRCADGAITAPIRHGRDPVGHVQRLPNVSALPVRVIASTRYRASPEVHALYDRMRGSNRVRQSLPDQVPLLGTIVDLKKMAQAGWQLRSRRESRLSLRRDESMLGGLTPSTCGGTAGSMAAAGSPSRAKPRASAVWSVLGAVVWGS